MSLKEIFSVSFGVLFLLILLVSISPYVITSQFLKFEAGIDSTLESLLDVVNIQKNFDMAQLALRKIQNDTGRIDSEIDYDQTLIYINDAFVISETLERKFEKQNPGQFRLIKKFQEKAEIFRRAYIDYVQEIRKDPSAAMTFEMERISNEAKEETLSVLSGMMRSLYRDIILVKSLFSETLRKCVYYSLFFLVLVMIGAPVLLYILMELIRKPLRYLASETEKVAQGNFESQVHLSTHDELGSLARSFNKMVRSLKKTTVSRDALQREIRERKRIEKQLLHSAYHDALTSLPNRALLLDRLTRLLERCKRYEHYSFAFLFIDFDRFKLINDSLGHISGDELLIQISERLAQCVRDSDTVSRFAGDEFVILQDGVMNQNDVIMLAKRIQNELQRSFEVSEQQIYLSASIGIALYNSAYENPGDVLRDADFAMYRAKSLGSGQFQIFDESMRTYALNSLQMEADLRWAAGHKTEFFIEYQPIFSLRTKKIVQLEALLRWKHPQKGEIYPEDFIPIAEETGLIIGIGQWVIKEVCQQCRAWRDKGYPEVPVAINFSTRQFQERGFVKFIKEAISDAGIPAQAIRIEITESVAMQNIEQNISALHQLSESGIQISIDDFGMGYSSLNSLKIFPIDHLKIDRSFIYQLNDNPTDTSIVRAVIKMGHSLGFGVVAEGVETKRQLDFLIKNGCDQAQGYLLGRPVPVSGVQKNLMAKEFSLSKL